MKREELAGMELKDRLRSHTEAIVGDYPTRHAGSEGILHTALDTVYVCSFPKMTDGVITRYEPATRLI